jgi:single-strand DNA-binding protein
MASDLQYLKSGGLSMSLNKVLIIGNLGSDPDVRYLPSGKPATSFRIATNRQYKIEGELRKEVEWFSVVAFGRLAEICSEYLRKGKPVFIEGRMKTRNWTDANGAVHYRTEVIAEGMRLIGGRTNDGNRSNQSEVPPEQPDPDEPF